MTGDRLQTSCGSLAIVHPAISLLLVFGFIDYMRKMRLKRKRAIP
jgi:hypothetical protein